HGARVSEMWAGVQAGPCIRPQFPLEEAFRFPKEMAWHARRAGEQVQAQARSRRSPEGARRPGAAGRRSAIRSAATSSRRSPRSPSRSACTRRWTPSAGPSSTSPAPEPAPVPEPEPAPAAPVSPRLELRSKLLAAAPNLAKAAQSYRRNVATLRRAALPRRSPGPWRADREVLEEARRAVEFAQKLYDAYADGWADQPLTKDLGDQTAAELDRFLAWTQLDRYVELAVLASTNVPRPSKPGQHVI